MFPVTDEDSFMTQGSASVVMDIPTMDEVIVMTETSTAETAGKCITKEEAEHEEIDEDEVHGEIGLQLANSMLKKYISEHVQGFNRLLELREKMQSDAEETAYFQDNFPFPHPPLRPGEKKGKWSFYVVMRQIANELHLCTGALIPLPIPEIPMKILDLCMAPGGYSAAALMLPAHNSSIVYGITLDPEKGGHEFMIDRTAVVRRVKDVLFQDITMFAAEFGVAEIPDTHPEAANFVMDRPFLDEEFNLIFCDGVVLQTHKPRPHNKQGEEIRLLLSQLIFAMQRVIPGGTIIIRMDNVDAWCSTFIIFEISHFSEIRLFKPQHLFDDKGLFYLIATFVEPRLPEAAEVLKVWKECWHKQTFGGENGIGDSEIIVGRYDVKGLLDEFGLELMELGRGIWAAEEAGLSEKLFANTDNGKSPLNSPTGTPGRAR